MTDAEFYAYLREQFSDLAGAKRFMYRWASEEDQPEINGQGFSSRAMAYHVSCVLEGHTSDPNPHSLVTTYLDTRYGPDLYFAAWSKGAALAPV